MTREEQLQRLQSWIADCYRGFLGRPPALILMTALTFGLLSGLFAVSNTSIGWHTASGRWMLEHRQVIRGDPFTYTATGTEWVDHEWLFQVIVAALDAVGGAPALIGFRCLLGAGLAVLLLAAGLRSRLAPPVALLLASLCIYGAQIRFFLRPELCTLVMVLLAVTTYLGRQRQESGWWLVRLGLIVVLAVNLHGAALIIPVLLGALWTAEAGCYLLGRCDLATLRSGAAAVAVVLVAPILNPFGWQLYTIPIKITHLVGLPHIPNPEWISPGPQDLPTLYVALAVALLVTLLKGRDPVRWMLLLATAAMALRYVRNVGLFYVLLPLVLAPALARWQSLSADGRLGNRGDRRQVAQALACALAALLATGFFIAPLHQLGLSYSPQRYPIVACDFAEQTELLDVPLYNDVNFGGYLIGRYFPPRQVFLDDRNEIHEPLLREIYSIFQRSDLAAWKQLLHRYGIETAFVRYHQPIRVITPDGVDHGWRGFSVLWFPSTQWALVYWDDVAMVFVKRDTAAAELLEQHEYRLIRPDDLDSLVQRLAQGRLDRRQLAIEIYRKLEQDPDSWRVQLLADALLALK
jgi:hypothetical protein